MSEFITQRNPRAISSSWAWLFAPDGRMARGDFFIAILYRALVLGFSLALISEMALISDDLRRAVPIWTLATILSAGGPMIQRLHDIGHSGLHAPWLCFATVLGCALNYQLPHPIRADTALFFFLSWVPYLLILALILWPGTKGPNRYGPLPSLIPDR